MGAHCTILQRGRSINLNRIASTYDTKLLRDLIASLTYIIDKRAVRR